MSLILWKALKFIHKGAHPPRARALTLWNLLWSFRFWSSLWFLPWQWVYHLILIYLFFEPSWFVSLTVFFYSVMSPSFFFCRCAFFSFLWFLVLWDTKGQKGGKTQLWGVLPVIGVQTLILYSGFCIALILRSDGNFLCCAHELLYLLTSVPNHSCSACSSAFKYSLVTVPFKMRGTQTARLTSRRSNLGMSLNMLLKWMWKQVSSVLTDLTSNNKWQHKKLQVYKDNMGKSCAFKKWCPALGANELFTYV